MGRVLVVPDDSEMGQDILEGGDTAIQLPPTGRPLGRSSAKIVGHGHLWLSTKHCVELLVCASVDLSIFI